MENLEDFFSKITEDEDQLKNIAMFFVTIFVNMGILKIHWNSELQEFVFTVANDEENEEEKEESNPFDIDPDDIISRMLNRKKKKD